MLWHDFCAPQFHDFEILMQHQGFYIWKIDLLKDLAFYYRELTRIPNLWELSLSNLVIKPPLHRLSLSKSPTKKPHNIIRVGSGRQPNQTQLSSTKPNIYHWKHHRVYMSTYSKGTQLFILTFPRWFLYIFSLVPLNYLNLLTMIQ